MSHRVLKFIKAYYRELLSKENETASLSILLISSNDGQDVRWLPEKSSSFDLSVSVLIPYRLIYPGNNLVLIGHGLNCIVKTLQSRYPLSDKTRQLLDESIDEVLDKLASASEDYIFTDPFNRSKFDLYGNPLEAE